MKEKYFNIATWIATACTILLWLPVMLFGFMNYAIATKGIDGALTTEVIGGADGPTAVYVTTIGFISGPMDWVILISATLFTGALWYIKIKKKKEGKKTK